FWPLPMQALPQTPQLLRSVASLTSQPFCALLSQSAYPGTQPPLLHIPALQPITTLAGAGQALPHIPQWATLEVISTPHPFPSILSQLPKPCEQAETTQAPPAQAATARGSCAHTEPQPPQLLGSMSEWISQPLAA